MTAEPPRSPVTEAARSLEVRWIFPGQLETAVARWFNRFPAHRELQATAALVFASPLPAGMEPGPDYSRSYAEWLGRPPGAESDAGT